MPKNRQKIFFRKTEAKKALSAAVMVGLLMFDIPPQLLSAFSTTRVNRKVMVLSAYCPAAHMNIISIYLLIEKRFV
ncbi:MAG TPA: hypothetical protein DCG57_05865 [Candidatus Riflebacteria bacterium]|jgi:hypothetical protein|nr:hypothetical protein [Candidatus Riflebacteria bacterium]